MGYSIIDAGSGQPFNESLEGANQVNAGKTKIVSELPNGQFAISHENVLTAFDNPDFTAEAPGKWTVSAYSSAVLFRRIGEAWVRTTHEGIINPNTTREKPLKMLPFEIIWRRYNVKGNSWAQRNAEKKVVEGIKYDEIIYEVWLKWSVIDAVSGKECTDPFMVLDENFEPRMDGRWLPLLVHQKTGKEIQYNRIVHPNKKEDISAETLKATIEQYKIYAAQIREMAEKVQQVTFDTYAQIGRLNADGKIEVGLDKEGKLTLGDELELDALRNISLKKIKIGDKEYEYKEDLLGRNLNEVIEEGADRVSLIVEANHSGKQAYRDMVGPWKIFPMSALRIGANALAARQVTQGIYAPTAQALSDRFGKEVGYILRAS